MLRRSSWVVVFLVLVVALLGCAAKQPYVIHPGSIPLASDNGAFDSHTADFLSEERAFLDSFKGKTEPQAVQEALEYAEKQYTVTKASYLAWRGAQTAANLAALNVDKTKLTNATGAVATATQGGK